MDDLILRKDAIEAAIEGADDWDGGCNPNRDEVITKHINEVPTVGRARAYGRWLKVHGYVTPGGDSVWKCSICGKGKHVYGIEHVSYGADIADGQWVSCPNCGAVMDGEEW